MISKKPNLESITEDEKENSSFSHTLTTIERAMSKAILEKENRDFIAPIDKMQHKPVIKK